MKGPAKVVRSTRMRTQEDPGGFRGKDTVSWRSVHIHHFVPLTGFQIRALRCRLPFCCLFPFPIVPSHLRTISLAAFITIQEAENSCEQPKRLRLIALFSLLVLHVSLDGSSISGFRSELLPTVTQPSGPDNSRSRSHQLRYHQVHTSPGLAGPAGLTGLAGLAGVATLGCSGGLGCA